MSVSSQLCGMGLHMEYTPPPRPVMMHRAPGPWEEEESLDPAMPEGKSDFNFQLENKCLLPAGHL